jgi:signal transduction histidine kinase
VLLSTARIYINEVEDCESDSERKELIGQSKSMVDEAITNARNISNNIMPAALKRNGLVDTLKSFSEKINISGNISIKVKSENTKKHYKSTTEITLYRILTEMINNTLKHANASLISISLIQENNYLHITYSDDGIGFDYDKMIRSSQKGSGLDNTISRVNSVGGTCTISSKTGKGFNASIKVAI